MSGKSDCRRGFTETEVNEMIDEKIYEYNDILNNRAHKDHTHPNYLLRIIIGLLFASAIYFCAVGGHHTGLKLKQWRIATFNESERIDCLEQGHHDWSFVGYEGAFEWSFKCDHCGNESTTSNLNEHQKRAFRRATGLDFVMPEKPEGITIYFNTEFTPTAP
jgi:hypothetical protein